MSLGRSYPPRAALPAALKQVLRVLVQIARKEEKTPQQLPIIERHELLPDALRQARVALRPRALEDDVTEMFESGEGRLVGVHKVSSNQKEAVSKIPGMLVPHTTEPIVQTPQYKLDRFDGGNVGQGPNVLSASASLSFDGCSALDRDARCL